MHAIQQELLPHYLVFKWVHLLAVSVWALSTAVAYAYYVAPAFRAWLRKPDDAAAQDRRDRAIAAFDRGVVLEHVAFPIVLATGVLMVWLNGWRIDEVNWLSVKLGIVVLVFLPVEIVDYHISHFGGRKQLALKANDRPRYERQIRFHWLFFRVTEWIILIFVPATFFLAVVKPF